MKPLQVCVFKWASPGYRSKFGPEQVDIMYRMVKRNYPHPFEFNVFTDDPTGISEPEIKVWDLWDDLAACVNPSGKRNPSCYRRLKLFARNVGEWLGDRIVWIDLDAVIVGDMSAIWNRPEDFVIWADSNRVNPFNGSMILFDAGARPQLWEDFDPAESPKLGARAGYFGSDQAWIAAKLGPNEATWNRMDGVYSFRNEIVPNNPRMLPKAARVVFFHGKFDNWEPATQKLAPWIKDFYF